LPIQGYSEHFPRRSAVLEGLGWVGLEPTTNALKGRGLLATNWDKIQHILNSFDPNKLKYSKISFSWGRTLLHKRDEPTPL
jgi:hypothetical protein